MSTIGLTHMERRERRREMAEAVKAGASQIDVAIQFGVTHATVRQACIEFFVIHPTPRPAHKRRKVRLNKVHIVRDVWRAVCWDRSDTEIASVLGVCRERVRQIRRELGKPDAEVKRIPVRTLTVFDAMKEHASEIGNMPAHGVVDFLKTRGVESRVHQVQIYARRLGIRLQHASTHWTLIPWDTLNWSLPNATLGEAWGVPNNRVGQRRCNHRKGSASITEDSPEYAALVEVEKHKSEQWRAVTPKELWPETILV